MELLRKRKGAAKWSSLGPHLSCDDDVARERKKGREEPRICSEKEGSCRRGHLTTGVVLTAPPCSGSSSSSGSPCRGLKRKLGCIESTTRLGRKKKLELEYILGPEIGQGKFGSVWMCRRRATGQEFACKTLPKNGEETVHREVEIMQHLSGHPGVVTLNAVYEDSECFHLVMELCSGGRLLDQMAREGRFSEQRAAKLLKELISVIKYCHDMGVIHRDIKPENILLTTSGKMKLADFGLAARVSHGQKLSGIAGSPAYVAPEVLSGYYSEKVDIWGAGVLLHALLVGILPFQGDSLEAIFEAIKTVQLDFHSRRWESISVLARDLIGQMLTRDVTARLTADEVLRHPWILFYTEDAAKGPDVRFAARNNVILRRVESKRLGSSSCPLDSGSVSSTECADEPEDNGFVDILTVALSRVRISEPKRSRLCVPASPIPQECSSNLKANLCTAF
uniref:Serine/threonine-protein kinase PEPKR2 n=1 Tax=Anthurium amnicola TaxID=1678845 RepID=A0A1D1YZG5_9ARAE